MSEAPARLGPDPTLISRKEVDVLYEILASVIKALKQLDVDYIVTGGSLLGAIRQHSILFCDDDIDIAIVEDGTGAYNRVSENLGHLLGSDYAYSIRPWEGGDKIRAKRMPSVFLDLFTIRQYNNQVELTDVIGIKANGSPQNVEYVSDLIRNVTSAAGGALFPLWHFNTRKAIEMWPKEVYRENELFPLATDLKFGPLTRIQGPRTPVRLLRRAFGADCFDVFYQGSSHGQKGKKTKVVPAAVRTEAVSRDGGSGSESNTSTLSPVLLEGGTWEHAEKLVLEDLHYVRESMIVRLRNEMIVGA